MDIFPKSQKITTSHRKTPLPRTPGTPGTTPWPSVERSSVQVESKVLLQNVGFANVRREPVEEGNLGRIPRMYMDVYGCIWMYVYIYAAYIVG